MEVKDWNKAKVRVDSHPAYRLDNYRGRKGSGLGISDGN